jgi:UDP-N-acetylglucosamine:LPS N-acetylglucosamine transferase
MKQKIVFAMIEAGGGHKAPAKAVMDAIEARWPGRYEMRMMDFIKDVGAVDVDASHKQSWKSMLEHPTMTHMLFQIENVFAPASRAVMYRTMVAPAVPYTMRFLREYKPDIVFSTHFFATMALDEARRRSGVEFELITFLTEMFTYHAPWRLPGTDWFLTASERAAQTVARHGIEAKKIKSFPYPIRPDFLSSRRDKGLVERELGLDPSRKTVLFSFGGQGAGMILQYLITLDLLNVPLNVVVVAGLNKSLKQKLAASASLLTHLNIVSLGYVNNMNELIEAADLCFIKPGPATMMECMHSKKPLIFSLAATPCEQAHANYATFRGVARYAGGNAVAFGRAAKYFLSEEGAAEVRRRYEGLALRNGAPDIAAFVHDLAERG